MITLLDVNDESPKCDRQTYSITIVEDTAVNSVIGTLICSDNDNDPLKLNNKIDSFVITDGNIGM